MTETSTLAPALALPPARPDRARVYRLGGWAVLIIVLVLLPFNLDSYWVGTITGWIPLALAALGLNLLTGYNGQISVGHGAIYGVGAYSAALLITNWHWSFLAAVVGASVVCFALGIVLGLPALRIKGLYLALVTLAVAALFPQIIQQFGSFTHGNSGLGVTSMQLYRGSLRPRSVVFNAPGWTGLESDQWTYLWFLAVAAVCFVLVRNVVNSRVGRSLVAIRDNEVAAETNGVNVSATKVLTFGFSSALAGVGGALFALKQTNVFPGSFTLVLSISFLIAVVVGGSATILGPAVGAVFYGVFNDVITPKLSDRLHPAVPLILGATLVLLVLVAPQGLVGLVRTTGQRISTRRGASTQPPTVDGHPAPDPHPTPVTQPTPDSSAPPIQEEP